MKFICAQPDKPLFIWELKVLLTSMFKLNISKDDIFFLVLLEDRDEPSQEMQELEKYARIFYFKDRGVLRPYKPATKPYLFGRFFEDNPEYLNEYFFYVESDMLIHKIPTVELNEDIWYWSDASPWLEMGQLEDRLGFEKGTGKSFGFHAIGKGISPEIWYKIESDSEKLYIDMIKNPATHLNIWICEMRTWMWNMKESGKINVITPELDFNHGRGLRKENVNLHHQLDARIFNKRLYKDKAPWDIEMIVDPLFSLADYINGIKEAAKIFK